MAITTIRASSSSSSSSSLLILNNNHKTSHFIFSLKSKETSLFHPFPSISFSLSLSFSPLSITPRVSTAPLEYASPASESNNFQQEIPRLKTLHVKLSTSKTLKHKLKVLDFDDKVHNFLNTQGCTRFLGSFGLGLNELFLEMLGCSRSRPCARHWFWYPRKRREFSESPVKTVLYSLVEMIEKWDSNNGR